MKNKVVKNTKGFRINAKCFFLTYPQCLLTKEDVIDNLKLFCKNHHREIEWYVCALEEHEEDGLHIHLVFSLAEALDVKNENLLDVIGGKHGNYQATRNKQSVIKYVIEDGDYIEEGIDAKEFLRLSMKKKSTLYATKLRDGELNVRDILKDDPEYYYNHKRKIDDYIITVKKLKNEDVYKENVLKDITLYGWQLEAQELLKDQTKRQILWIYDEIGNVGKSDYGRYLYSQGDCYLIRGGKVVDITKGYDYEKLIVFDIPRDNQEFINYSLIEMFKDGSVQSNKFDSHVKFSYGNKVLVLANSKPEVNNKTLSNDRIVCMNIIKSDKSYSLKKINF